MSEQRNGGTKYSDGALEDAVKRRDSDAVLALIEVSPLEARSALIQISTAARGHADSKNATIAEARADSFAGRIDRASYEDELAEYKRWLHGNKRFVAWIGRFIMESQNAQTRARGRVHEENQAHEAGRLADAIRLHAYAARAADIIPADRDLALWATIGIKAAV